MMRKIAFIVAYSIMLGCNSNSNTKKVEHEYVENLEKKNDLLKKELDSLKASKESISESTKTSLQETSKMFDGDDYLEIIDLPTSAPLYNRFLNSFSEHPVFTHELDNTYVKFKEKGIEVLIEKNRLEHEYVHTIYFFANKYKSKLPAGLSFDMDEQEIYKKLDYPTKKGGGDEFYGKPVPYWDKWVFDKYAIHVQYNSINKPTQITVMSNNEDIFNK